MNHSIRDKSDSTLTLEYELLQEPYSIPGSPFHAIVAQTRSHGEALFMDGALQSAKADEYIYHEMLVHSLLVSLRKKERILILGGAEGCTAREVLRWQDVQKVVQVDLDQVTCDWFRSNGEMWHSGSYSDSRLTVIYEDAMIWLAQAAREGHTFDGVIVDLFDPGEQDLTWFKGLMEAVRAILTVEGGFVINAGPAVMSETTRELCGWIRTNFRFPLSRAAMHVFVPSFGNEWLLLLVGPYVWEALRSNPRLPAGLRRFSVAELLRTTAWPNDAADLFYYFSRLDLQEFRIRNEMDEKIAKEIKKDEKLEFYGC